MIIELNNNNLYEIDNSFLDKELVKKELINNPFAKYLILKENNQVIGYLYYSDIYERAEINQFEVETNHRNCGKGTLLLTKLTEIVEKNITLEVKKNNIAAIELYKKFNFIEAGIRKGYYNGIDAILMERTYKGKKGSR